ncbi:MAG: hypothetical protein ABIH27_05035 [Candidatus Omnitrophota bacterium]
MLIRRKNYLINPKIQLTYIGMCVIPALATVILATYFLVKSTEIKLYRQQESFLVGISIVDSALFQLEKAKDEATVTKRLQEAKQGLIALQSAMKYKQNQSLQALSKNRDLIILDLIAILILVGFLSLIYSHRIAGPLFRIEKNIDMLAEGKPVPPISLRRGDEFKNLAAALEKLRKKLEK